MKKKIQSTIWLDLITYIILPLIVIGSSWNLFFAIFHMKWGLYSTVMVIVEISLTIFYGLTVYQTHKRTALAPKLLRALFWITAFQASFEFANTEYMNKGYNLFLMFGIYFAACYIVWIRTNETYLQNRMDIFGREHSLKKNYRCEKCKRLVPLGMECPHCKNLEKESPEKETKEKNEKKVVEKEEKTTEKKESKKETLKKEESKEKSNSKKEEKRVDKK